MTGKTKHQRGFALLVVLWALAVSALLGTQLVTVSRERTQVARNLRDAALLEAAVNGGIEHAIFEILNDSGSLWNLDGTAHAIRVGAFVVTLRLEDEGGKVNPNIATEDLLAAVLEQIGVEPRRAATLAAAIADWRDPSIQPRLLGAKTPQYTAAGRDYGPPGVGFTRIDELGLVLGMTPKVLKRVRPHLTLYTDADPDLSSRDPVVALALQATTDSSSAAVTGIRLGRGIQIASVTASARGANHTALRKRVVVRTNVRGSRDHYEILASEQLGGGGLNDGPHLDAAQNPTQDRR